MHVQGHVYVCVYGCVCAQISVYACVVCVHFCVRVCVSVHIFTPKNWTTTEMPQTPSKPQQVEACQAGELSCKALERGPGRPCRMLSCS